MDQVSIVTMPLPLTRAVLASRKKKISTYSKRSDHHTEWLKQWQELEQWLSSLLEEKSEAWDKLAKEHQRLPHVQYGWLIDKSPKQPLYAYSEAQIEDEFGSYGAPNSPRVAELKRLLTEDRKVLHEAWGKAGFLELESEV